MDATAAATQGLPLQRSAHTGLLTDLSYIQFMGSQGVACLDVGVPVRYSHSALEVVDPDDIAGARVAARRGARPHRLRTCELIRAP